ncbi:MAG: class I SAM-dependent RNA methyltransferase [Actinomycetota bacterium]
MIELRPTDVAHGGEAVARLDGKVHFVDGAMPGERVVGEVVRSTASWARVALGRVLEASPQRVEPPCRHFDTCGGCQWQFADYPAQLEWKRSILTGQLAHLGRLADPPVRATVAVAPPYGYRNRVDFEVLDGRPAFHRRHSHDLEPITNCLVLHPLLAETVDRIGDLGEARRLTVRAASTSGDTLAVVHGPIPDGAAAWGCLVSRRDGDVLRPVVGAGAITETVAGVPLRITGDAFFQNNTPGAEALVRLVEEALDPQPTETLLDAYAGGGLFGATVGRKAGRVVAIEASPLGVLDLVHNLTAGGIEHSIIAAPVERAGLHGKERWQVAVVDPPRTGLGVEGVHAVVDGGPRAIAYVSCDPASLARDSRHLADAGYRLDRAVPVDLFPQTFHLEAVASFVPA